MKVKVLGMGCAKCQKLYAETEKAIAAAGVAAGLEKVEKLDEIMKYRVMMTPASGRIPTTGEMVTWLIDAAAKAQG
jgi:hypothetical protein